MIDLVSLKYFVLSLILRKPLNVITVNVIFQPLIVIRFHRYYCSRSLPRVNEAVPVTIWLMLSVPVCPKVIILSSFHMFICTCIQFLTFNFPKMFMTFLSIIFISCSASPMELKQIFKR